MNLGSDFRQMGSNTGAYLKLILGPMFSGKTSQLIRIYKHNKIAEIPTLVINHTDDVRYSEQNLSTHDGVEIPCIKISKLGQIYSHLSQSGNSDHMNYHTILINEGQFFEDLYSVVKNLLQRDELTIVVCGLDGDYKMDRFGQILDLIPLSNEVEKLYAICKYCKKRAHFTQRTTKEVTQKVIGHTDKYVPVCRKCFHKYY